MKIIKLLIVSFSFILTFSCGDANKSAGHKKNERPSPAIVGGYQQVKIDTSSKKALDLALKNIDRKTDLLRIVSVKKQIVNGTNYKFVVDLKNDEQWTFTVYKSLKGDFELTSQMQKQQK